MILTFKRWDQIRDKFTEEEKTAINAAQAGVTICPPGLTLDERTLEDDLRVKLTAALEDEKMKDAHRVRR